MTPERRKNFNRLLNPRHIAFIGGEIAVVAIGEARRCGFAGEMWPVNPRRSDMAGIPCYPSVDDLPQTPDAVFLAVPVLAAIETVAKLAAMGAGGIVCYTAGFKEAGGAGNAAEKALMGVVGDMALIGPNCYGVINYLGNSALWPFAHGGNSPGFGAAIITQSGMFSSDITMSQRSLPLTHMISAGNQAILGLEDFIDVLCENPAVRAIGLHIEGLKDVPRFERAALKAMSLDTPIVALKTGSSVIGNTLTVSHTGSLSGANELYDALFERTGVIKVTNPSQLLETLKYLCVAGAPNGSRVIGFTCSGGGATMLADHGETIGLTFPEFAPEDASALADLLPSIASVSNPLDYTTPIWGQSEFTAPVFETALSTCDSDVAILVQDYPAPGLDESKVYYQNDAQAFCDAAAKSGIPAVICATIPENMDAETREHLIANGVAPMQGIHEALNALSTAASWKQAKKRILANPPDPLQSVPEFAALSLLDEAAGKALLAKANVPVPLGRCVNGDLAAKAAAELGFPVVLKMMGPKLAHKTEAGAVVLGLNSIDAVTKAVEAMRKAVARYDAGAVTDRFLVEGMAAPPLVELIAGIRRDPQFGYAMTLGSGGILAELIGDAKTLLLPASRDEIKRTLGELKVARMLNGFRGQTKVDIDVLALALFGLSEFVLSHSDQLAEVEINPMFVYEKGIIAVDVLIHTGPST